MHTKLDRIGGKTTIVNASDLKTLRAAREMAEHIAQNVPTLDRAGDAASRGLEVIVEFYDGSDASVADGRRLLDEILAAPAKA